jgi:hypothetical protein
LGSPLLKKIYAMIFSIFDRILKFYAKKVWLFKFFICLELLLIRIGRIQIGITWIPTLIQVKREKVSKTSFAPIMTKT